MIKKVAFILMAPVSFISSMEITNEELCSLLNDTDRRNAETITALVTLSEVQKKLLGALMKDEPQKLVLFYKECATGKSAKYKPLAVLCENLAKYCQRMEFENICLFITRLTTIPTVDASFKPIIDEALEWMFVEGARLNNLEMIRFMLTNHIPVPDVTIWFEEEMAKPEEQRLEVTLPYAVKRLGHHELSSLLLNILKK